MGGLFQLFGKGRDFQKFGHSSLLDPDGQLGTLWVPVRVSLSSLLYYSELMLRHKWKSTHLPSCKWNLLSHVQLFETPWTVGHQVALSMKFSRQEYWSGLPFLSPGDLPDSGIEHRSPVLQVDSFHNLSHQGSPHLPSCTDLILISLCRVLRLHHSFKSCALPSSLLFHSDPISKYTFYFTGWGWWWWLECQHMNLGNTVQFVTVRNGNRRVGVLIKKFLFGCARS